MTRCVPCVEKRLRALVKQRTEELRQVQEENAKLKEAAREYSYNEHFPDCKINNPNIRRCNCGYEALAALLGGE